MIDRYLTDHIRQDLSSKLVLLSGPRQVGKTTLAQSLENNAVYLNYDIVADRKGILAQDWIRSADLVVFDELHKLKKWKTWLKGVWDGRRRGQQILVTGSARLDTFRKGGDSLAGRFFHYSLHPFSIKELAGYGRPEPVLDRLIARGGFPEPFLAKSEDDAARWRLSHIDRIVRDDVAAIDRVQDIRQLELLVELLAERVGGTLSYKSLSEELSVSAPTVKRWIGILEALYVVFLVHPFTRSSTRSIKKEPKVFFVDTGRLSGLGNAGASLENIVACHLLKWCDYQTETRGIKYELRYIRDKEKREVDFAIIKNNKAELLLEVKSSDDTLHPALAHYSERLGCRSVQLVKNLPRAKDVKGIEIRSASQWLGALGV